MAELTTSLTRKHPRLSHEAAFLLRGLNSDNPTTHASARAELALAPEAIVEELMAELARTDSFDLSSVRKSSRVGWKFALSMVAAISLYALLRRSVLYEGFLLFYIFAWWWLKNRPITPNVYSLPPIFEATVNSHRAWWLDFCADHPTHVVTAIAGPLAEAIKSLPSDAALDPKVRSALPLLVPADGVSFITHPELSIAAAEACIRLDLVDAAHRFDWFISVDSLRRFTHGRVSPEQVDRLVNCMTELQRMQHEHAAASHLLRPSNASEEVLLRPARGLESELLRPQ